MNQRGRPTIWERGFVAPRTGVEIAVAAVTAISTVATVVGTISQGNAAAAAAAANADARRRAAAVEQQLGQQAYARQQRINLINRGRSLAALAGAGVDPFEGSPLDLLSQQAAEGEYAAASKRFEHDQKAWLLRMGASQEDMAGTAAQSGALGRAIGAGFGGAARLGSMGLDLLRTGSGSYDLARDTARTAGDRDLAGYN